jgi:hypothetical protein
MAMDFIGSSNPDDSVISYILIGLPNSDRRENYESGSTKDDLT